MTRPAWLPPLNSHDNYSINVGIHQFNHIPTSMRSPEDVNSIRIMFCVDVKFYSDCIDDNQDWPYFDGLSLCKMKEIRRVPPSEDKLRNYVKRFLEDREVVPFKVDKIKCYRETDELEHMLDQSYDNKLHSQDDLVDRITDFLFCTMSQYSQMGGQTLAIVLLIEKLVTVPDQEFQAWISWYEEQMMVNPEGFEDEYWEAINVPRTTYELWYESSLRAYESAATSCIESLETLALDLEAGDSKTIISCSICLEQLGNGEKVTKLPCSHVFHGDCVVQWLKTSHFCPLCRFLLPTSS